MEPKKNLSLFDAITMTIGTIVGVGIYETSPLIANYAPNASSLIFIWILGGLLCLSGALSYAELSTNLPYNGGDYIYLTKAFGKKLGFLFAWTKLTVIHPGSVGAMSFVFARYATSILPLGPHSLFLYALFSIIAITCINIIGVIESKIAQNLLTFIKVFGLFGILGISLFLGTHAFFASTPLPSSPSAQPIEPSEIMSSSIFLLDFKSLTLGLVLVLFTFGGWNEVANIASEIKNPKKNLYKALVYGTTMTSLIYILVNIAFIRTLGFATFQKARTPVTDVFTLLTGSQNAKVFVALLLGLSSLGAIHGMVFCGARIYQAMGAHHGIFKWLSKWHPRLNTPLHSLLAEGFFCILLVVAFSDKANEFESMVVFTTPLFWFFMFLESMSLFILRARSPHWIMLTRRRYSPYRLAPYLFSLSAFGMFVSSLRYSLLHASLEALWALGSFGLGIVILYLGKLKKEVAMNL